MTLAMVFPGQGSQSIGMLGELAAAEPTVQATFEQASAVLGYDLWQLLTDGPAEDLNATDRTQPALLSAGVAVFRVWQAHAAPSPAMMAGHSLGEYTALVCAGAIDFEAAVDLVRYRGQLMQAAVPPGEGAMAALLGLDDQQVAQACEKAAQGEVVAPVNFNAPGQVVIAGGTAAVARAVVQARELGARRVVDLPVSVPSHCALMQPAAEQLATRLADIEIRPPQIPVIHNTDAAIHREPAEIRQVLAAQLHQPVKWVDCVHAMMAAGATAIVEAGPGKVLAGLNRRIDRKLVSFPVFDPGTLAAALGGLNGGSGT
ncbi:MAG: ACP S-malonyltransferase [Gammaproteobacteria bacterium]